MSFHSFIFIYSCFLKQRFNRAFKKIKNKRIIAVTKKSRVNKEIRRILIIKNRITKENVKKERTIIIKKKRVNAKSLKYILLLLFRFFLIEFF